LNRIECVEAFARVRGDAIVIVSPGYSGHQLAAVRHEAASIYNMDMPYASPMCLGLALARPEQRVVAFEGDGSMLMALGALTTIGRYRPANLTVIVFQNETYLTTGDGTVPTAPVDFAGIARSAGVAQATNVVELPEFETAVGRALAEPGPWLIAARVDRSDRGDPRGRGDFEGDLVEQAIMFQRALRERGITTFGGAH
jgi:thiamine pyrophosphate-dependent acetolactate synthase large subunit-like protein